MTLKPIIGCATYQKTLNQAPPLDIYGVMPTYLEAVAAAGGIPLMIPLGLSEEDLVAVLDRVDGLLLPGGGDIEPHWYHGNPTHPTLYGIDPLRDDMEIFLARHVVKSKIPLLAICRGCQVLNVALGGTLWEDIMDLMPGAIRHNYYREFPRNYLAHEVQVQEGTQLAQLLGVQCVPVNSLHHQGIRDKAAELTASAVAPDGVIEAAEVSGHPFAIGVQWHPENLVQDSAPMRGLFEAFVAACEPHRTGSGRGQA